MNWKHAKIILLNIVAEMSACPVVDNNFWRLLQILLWTCLMAEFTVFRCSSQIWVNHLVSLVCVKWLQMPAKLVCIRFFPQLCWGKRRENRSAGERNLGRGRKPHPRIRPKGSHQRLYSKDRGSHSGKWARTLLIQTNRWPLVSLEIN